MQLRPPPLNGTLLALALAATFLVGVFVGRLGFPLALLEGVGGQAARPHEPPSGTATASPGPSSTPPPKPSPTPLPTATRSVPTPTAVPATPTPPPPPTATPVPREPVLKETKWGVGVYASGGHLVEALLISKPGVILLMDPDPAFAREVRHFFPKALIIGRRFPPNEHQPLDNPEERGRAFADWVAELAVPLKGVVDAWMSYNEVVGHRDYQAYERYNRFQVAFAERLQGHYGIDAVAGNDAVGTVDPEDYPRYFADAIRASAYFGVHAYPPRGSRSMREQAEWYVLRYRKIHAALEAAGITGVRMILTETGLFEGWRGVVSEQEMAEDFMWLTREIEKDPYVVGHTAFGIFANGTWQHFDLYGTSILTTMGNYEPASPSG